MSEFSAIQAAVLADDVYALTRMNSIKQATTYLKSEHGDIFDFDEKNMLKGVTGGPGFIKTRTAFGFTLLGKGSLKGQAVILFRGTQYLADWLTNLNITASRSASGEPVHDGFNQAFKSMESKIREFMSIVAKNNVHTIHCIGHSLGGALATLCGDWLASNYKRGTYIYTFGSPRVGLQTFVTACTRNVGADRIFRAYHKTDIVPFIPTWPYIHTPNSGRDYYLPSPGIVPMAKYHGMDQYLNSVEGQSWDLLADLRSASKDDSRTVQWLKSSTPLGLTITSIEWLNRALIYVLNKITSGAAWLISSAVSSSFTLMDRLAYMLQRGVDLAENVSKWVLYLIRKIAQVIGFGKVVNTIDLTQSFIRMLLTRLQSRVHQFTHNVLSKVLVDGRAV
ncbi:MAG: lipase [Alteromonadaceae bacterium]|nr:MAG: lipase [Alteromonadaceae bacterium]